MRGKSRNIRSRYHTAGRRHQKGLGFETVEKASSPWLGMERGGRKDRKKTKRKKEVIALVYETHDRPGQHEIYVDREILTHPR